MAEHVRSEHLEMWREALAMVAAPVRCAECRAMLHAAIAADETLRREVAGLAACLELLGQEPRRAMPWEEDHAHG